MPWAQSWVRGPEAGPGPLRNPGDHLALTQLCDWPTPPGTSTSRALLGGGLHSASITGQLQGTSLTAEAGPSKPQMAPGTDRRTQHLTQMVFNGSPHDGPDFKLPQSSL